MKTDVEQLTVPQLEDALKKTWKRHAALKVEMSPLLSELRKRLRNPGSRKGKGWAAWVNEGHIGICLRTASRWADEHEGKTSGQKSGGRKRPPSSDGERTYQPPIFLVTEREEQQLKKAEKILGLEEVKRLIVETLLAAVAKKRPGNAQPKSYKAHA